MSVKFGVCARKVSPSRSPWRRRGIQSTYILSARPSTPNSSVRLIFPCAQRPSRPGLVTAIGLARDVRDTRRVGVAEQSMRARRLQREVDRHQVGLPVWVVPVDGQAADRHAPFRGHSFPGAAEAEASKHAARARNFILSFECGCW
ncbi:hypothetical protein HIM_03983 [Hirsutella minnesotensis 3608]|uniref:Uncharacterized protein n=1 Tax=Hirsutella minnesotensis 3608 TaxID=1043627 RepID=A0A0F8A228_9HYPO|nr:hypothetical protein HIM_03983 [Hirsutella minnesotensis 3608]